YAHTIGTARAGAWKDPEWSMFDMGGYGSGARFVLDTALKRRDRRLAEWALAHGASPNAKPARDKRFPRRSLYELALLEGLRDMADLLAQYGAVRSAPTLDDRERFGDACFRLDREAAAQMLRDHPDYLEASEFMFAAAARDRSDVLAFLLDLGFPLEI